MKQRINQIVEEYCDKYHLSTTQFAKALGMSYRTLQNYLYAERKPSLDFMDKLSQKTESNIYWLLNGKGPKYLNAESMGDDQFAYISRLQISASAGFGSINEATWQDQEQKIAFSKEWLQRKNLRSQFLTTINVHGDSMEPVLYDGDQVLVDSSRKQPLEGRIYVMVFNDALYIKYWRPLGNGKAELLSKNDFYDPIPVNLEHDNIDLIGQVVWSAHNFV